jgi:hypothetical protein
MIGSRYFARSDEGLFFRTSPEAKLDWDRAQVLPDAGHFLTSSMKFHAKKWDFVSQKNGN